MYRPTIHTSPSPGRSYVSYRHPRFRLGAVVPQRGLPAVGWLHCWPKVARWCSSLSCSY
ncbi:protein of unknown function (plasmid) [Ralstonia solanacearum PSI07]|nr:protein of unknown function [Ralstonia solanacearum PSI07]